MTSEKQVKAGIRANSHVLRLLGEELIGDDGLAVFELVKNGYDADAQLVSVTLSLKTSRKKITVEDDGSGMSLADLQEKWLVLATDSKRGEEHRSRSAKHNRLSLGEKGVGRIAAFKLGRTVTLTTKRANAKECQLSIDLDALIRQGTFLEDLSVSIEQRDQPQVFLGKSTGTKIEISDLYRSDWERADLRKLNRLVTSLASPFEAPDSFAVTFSVPGREKDIDGMFSADDFKEQAVWEYSFRLDSKGFSWSYRFKPPLWKSLTSRSLEKKRDILLLDLPEDGTSTGTSRSEPLVFHPSFLEGVGPISGVIYAYHKRTEVLKATGNQQQLKKWLDDQTGIRVYRDNVRVFNYGEPGDDWLGLNVRRINRPSERFGTTSLVAAISLNLESSYGLKEKTNREGFDSGGTFPVLRQLVLSVFDSFEKEAMEDRQRLDEFIRGKGVPEAPVKFVDAIENLRGGIKHKKIDAAFQRDIDAIEREYVQLRDVMVSAGSAGLNLAVIFHEIEREVDALAAAVNQKIDEKSLRKQIEQIHYMLHGFAPLLRKNPTKMIFCSEVLDQAVRIRQTRFAVHGVTLSVPLLAKEEEDFKIRASPNLLVGAIGNVIDNALYWSLVRRASEERKEPAAIRVVTQSRDTDGSSLIAVVDNGPGFSAKALDKAKIAFFSERPNGMGLGLYFASLVTEQMGGILTLTSADDLRDEVDIPEAFDGAAVVMRFGGN